MVQLLPDTKNFVKTRRTQVFASDRYPGWEVHYLVHTGALCQPIPGVGPEPAHVEIVDVRHNGIPVDFKLLCDFGGFDRQAFQEELGQYLLNGTAL